MSTYIRKLAHNMPYLGHPSFCHCKRCWQPSAARKAFHTIAPWIAVAGVVWFFGVLVIWAANNFPGLTRIGQ